MKVQPVITRKGLKEFINLPYKQNQHDSMWVAPLRGEQWSQFDPAKNPMLYHCTYQLFLLKEGNKVLGRISAFTDRLALEHWQQPIGLFGSFECVNDPAAANMLMDAASAWLCEQGMHAMRGPWSFASQEWGLVVEGFKPQTVILAPYNPPFYNDFMINFGLSKVMDLLVYEADMKKGYRIPERILTLTDKVAARYGVKVRPINMSKLEEDVVTIMRLANQSISDNWGFYPVTDIEARAMAHDLKQIVNPEALLIAENASGEPIGFALSLPDVNQVLKGLNGRLLPFGWLKMLTQIPKLSEYRMWALGVVPEYQGKAIDTLLYRATHDALAPLNVRMEINYVLENNDRMNNAIMKLGATPIRRYRVYEKVL
jgi:ribosomal protein S18 acetylase RimI-like enzyme